MYISSFVYSIVHVVGNVEFRLTKRHRTSQIHRTINMPNFMYYTVATWVLVKAQHTEHGQLQQGIHVGC